MANGVLVDTSFLITLANAERTNHPIARDYFRAALEQSIPLYLSALVATEFQRRQAIEDLGLHNFIVLPFNLLEAVLAGNLARELKRDDGDDRNSFAVDIMLLAQAHKNQIGAILTEDGDTLTRYCDRLRDQRQIECRTILLADGFDPGRLIDPVAPGLPFPVDDD